MDTGLVNMGNPLTTIHDAITGETVTREMTDAEAAWFTANAGTEKLDNDLAD